MSITVGEQIQSSTGTWSGSVPTSYTYQWQSSADGVTGWANIGGSTRSDLIVGSGLAGLWVRCGVVATTAGGSSAAVYSAAAGPVVAATVYNYATAPFVTSPALRALSGSAAIRASSSSPALRVLSSSPTLAVLA